VVRSRYLLDLAAEDKKSPPVNSTAKSTAAIPLADLNALDRGEFIARVGPVFEHSPWIAERVVDRRPFASVDALHSAMCDVVRKAGEEEQLALIRAHPDLVGRAVLTAESKSEQAAAGLLDVSPGEVALFDRYNRDYKARFGFPFVICARMSKKDAILAALPVRLQNSPDRERTTALGEICKIAALRLADLISE